MSTDSSSLPPLSSLPALAQGLFSSTYASRSYDSNIQTSPHIAAYLAYTSYLQSSSHTEVSQEEQERIDRDAVLILAPSLSLASEEEYERLTSILATAASSSESVNENQDNINNGNVNNNNGANENGSPPMDNTWQQSLSLYTRIFWHRTFSPAQVLSRSLIGYKQAIETICRASTKSKQLVTEKTSANGNTMLPYDLILHLSSFLPPMSLLSLTLTSSSHLHSLLQTHTQYVTSYYHTLTRTESYYYKPCAPMSSKRRRILVDWLSIVVATLWCAPPSSPPHTLLHLAFLYHDLTYSPYITNEIPAANNPQIHLLACLLLAANGSFFPTKATLTVSQCSFLCAESCTVIDMRIIRNQIGRKLMYLLDKIEEKDNNHKSYNSSSSTSITSTNNTNASEINTIRHYPYFLIEFYSVLDYLTLHHNLTNLPSYYYSLYLPLARYTEIICVLKHHNPQQLSLSIILLVHALLSTLPDGISIYNEEEINSSSNHHSNGNNHNKRKSSMQHLVAASRKVCVRLDTLPEWSESESSIINNTLTNNNIQFNVNDSLLKDHLIFPSPLPSLLFGPQANAQLHNLQPYITIINEIITELSIEDVDLSITIQYPSISSKNGATSSTSANSVPNKSAVDSMEYVDLNTGLFALLEVGWIEITKAQIEITNAQRNKDLNDSRAGITYNKSIFPHTNKYID